MAPCTVNARAALMRSIEGEKTAETLQSVITLGTIRDAITSAFQEEKNKSGLSRVHWN